ncbi:MAG: MerR family transcriptional regulator [Planctomycetota bacterium]|nr:MAG: MerR family transcriptional regulator [Planctomycetota bacterium]
MQHDLGDDWVSIGDTCRETGLTPHTLRVWERRYGRPVPERLPSGHRRFRPEQVRWLRQVAEALSLGFRPGRILKLSDQDLQELLEQHRPAPVKEQRWAPLLELVRTYDRDRLVQALSLDWRDNGPRACLNQLIVPLVHATGRAWADGELEVRHEHFLTQVLEDMLRRFREDQPLRSQGTTAILATLETEEHGLGLQLVALVFALHGLKALILGPVVPMAQILAAASEHPRALVAISVSLSTGGPATSRQLVQLRDKLPPGTELLVGGEGAQRSGRGPKGIHFFQSLEGLDVWLTERFPRGGA